MLVESEDENAFKKVIPLLYEGESLKDTKLSNNTIGVISLWGPERLEKWAEDFPTYMWKDIGLKLSHYLQNRGCLRCGGKGASGCVSCVGNGGWGTSLPDGAFRTGWD